MLTPEQKEFITHLDKGYKTEYGGIFHYINYEIKDDVIIIISHILRNRNTGYMRESEVIAISETIPSGVRFINKGDVVIYVNESSDLSNISEGVIFDNAGYVSFNDNWS